MCFLILSECVCMIEIEQPLELLFCIIHELGNYSSLEQLHKWQKWFIQIFGIIFYAETDKFILAFI